MFFFCQRRSQAYQREGSHILASEPEGSGPQIPFFLIRKKKPFKKKKKCIVNKKGLNHEIINELLTNSSLYRNMNFDSQLNMLSYSLIRLLFDSDKH